MSLKMLSFYRMFSLRNRSHWIIGVYLTTFSLGIVSAAEMMMQIEADPGRYLYPTIAKLSNNFYTCRIPHKNLTLVMERIDEQTQPFWLAYAKKQTGNALYLKEKEEKVSTGDGSWFFERVLDRVSYRDNEIWVAYVTKNDKPSFIIDSVKRYSQENRDAWIDAFAKDIEMFVTVTSSPKGLITSHMGIATSIEASKKRTKGVSIDLHSFAAKVMLMRNPHRKFMVNAPVWAMEKIIINALPNSVSIGTKELRAALQERKHLSFEEFKATNTSIIKKSDDADLLKVRYTIYKDLAYTRHHSMSVEEFLEITQKNPPMISVDPSLTFDPQVCIDRCLSRKTEREQTKHYNITIYNPKNAIDPWLSIDNDNKDYQWIFQSAFVPALSTHYIVVDLIDLANSRPIE